MSGDFTLTPTGNPLTEEQIEEWRVAIQRAERDFGEHFPPGSNALCDMARAALLMRNAAGAGQVGLNDSAPSNTQGNTKAHPATSGENPLPTPAAPMCQFCGRVLLDNPRCCWSAREKWARERKKPA